jgi:hypothetical protein
VVSFTPRPLYPQGKERPLPIRQEAGWAPEPIWTSWRREKCFPCREWNCGRRARSQPLSRLETYPSRRCKACCVCFVSARRRRRCEVALSDANSVYVERETRGAALKGGFTGALMRLTVWLSEPGATVRESCTEPE